MADSKQSDFVMAVDLVIPEKVKTVTYVIPELKVRRQSLVDQKVNDTAMHDAHLAELDRQIAEIDDIFQRAETVGIKIDAVPVATVE